MSLPYISLPYRESDTELIVHTGPLVTIPDPTPIKDRFKRRTTDYIVINHTECPSWHPVSTCYRLSCVITLLNPRNEKGR